MHQNLYCAVPLHIGMNGPQGSYSFSFLSILLFSYLFYISFLTIIFEKERGVGWKEEEGMACYTEPNT